jgi:glycosyltransferase involved in cell wall biosynthesis
MRDDFETVHGGDLVMVSNLQRCLKPLGIHLTIKAASELTASSDADILHLTFLHRPNSATDAIRWAEKRHVPVVMSPLFEDPLHLWFEWATYHPTKWRSISQLTGRWLARQIYLRWQGVRRRSSVLWQEQRKILQRVNLIPNSNYELDQLRHWFDLPELGGHVVPLGIDAEFWSRAPIGIDDTMLAMQSGFALQVGRIETRKNQIGLLRALLHDQVPIVLLGRKSPHAYEAPYVRACEELAAKRGNVHFVEWLPLEALPALYAAASVHVLPSWSELPGLVTLEAAACGCRVVSTSFSPIREYLHDDVWCCRPDKTGSVAQAVQKARRSPMPLGLQSKVLDTLTWHRSSLRLAAVYQSLAA